MDAREPLLVCVYCHIPPESERCHSCGGDRFYDFSELAARIFDPKTLRVKRPRKPKCDQGK
jgi:hypothetical protein